MVEINKNQYWKDIINELKASNMSILEFSKQKGLKSYNVGYYKRKFERENIDSFNGFIEVSSINEEHGSNLESSNVTNVLPGSIDSKENVEIEIKIKDISISIKSGDKLLSNIKTILKL